MPEAKRRGRPPLENPEDERYELRLSKDRLERYTKAAERAGKKLSAWMKGVLDRASRR
jgi:predicted HicB family RNase H-like nuclease